jgi:hypothetical protein
MKTLSLYFIVIIALTSALFSQEIPNGDGDLLWERSIYPRFVNDAKFHPINGNIIAAVNHEIWEIDPKDGHTIRVFEGGTASGEDDQFEGIQITSDGKTIVTDGGSGIEGLLIWDYETGKIRKVFDKGGPNRGSLGIFPDNKRVIFFTFKLQGSSDRQIVIYNFETDQIEKQVSIFQKAAQKLSLSKDGKNLAVGKTFNNNGDWIYTMELWDAETLTKIRDYGEDNTIGEFNDIQISSNNKYVAFQGGGHFNFFNLNGERISFNTFNWITFFGFSNNGDKTIIQGRWNNNSSYSAVINNPIDKPIYTFTKFFKLLRFNKNDEIFTGEETIKFFSNRWYTVDVKPGFETKTKVNYENDQLILTLPKDVIPQKISIMNLLGEIVYETSELTELNDKIVLDLTLPNGIYLISINDGKSTLFGKFVVVR